MSNFVLLDYDVVLEILKFAGPKSASYTGACCRDLATLPFESCKKMWKFFFQAQYPFLTKEEQEEEEDDWRGAFLYVYERQLLKSEWLEPPMALFADDGGHIAGYPAQNALSFGPEVWCTRPGVDKNVDLVAELRVPALVTAFRFANPENGYTMPLREGLAFASFDAPDLSAARKFDSSDTNNFKVPGAVSVRFKNDDDLAFVKDCEPTVANFVHFKLLRSYHPDSRTVNIDVRHLHVQGTSLPLLGDYLRSHRRCLERHADHSNASKKRPFHTVAALEALPNYVRLHPDAMIMEHRRLHFLPGNNHHNNDIILDDDDDVSQGLSNFRNDIIRMMIVTTAGIMTHMPIHLAALHPPPLH